MKTETTNGRREMSKRQIRISNLFGTYSVESFDSNEVWVSCEPGQDDFRTLGEAQDYVDGWIENNDDLEQVEGITR